MNGIRFLIRFWAGVCVCLSFGEGFSLLFGQPVPRFLWGATVGAFVWFAVLVWTATGSKKKE
jgi:hypothetical protein